MKKVTIICAALALVVAGPMAMARDGGTSAGAAAGSASQSQSGSAAGASSGSSLTINSYGTPETRSTTSTTTRATNTNVSTGRYSSENVNTNNTTNTAAGGYNNSINYGGSYSVRNVPNVVAPSLTTTLTETCMGSTSIGGAGVGFGVSFGTTWRDTACVRRLDARQLLALGHSDAATELMCDSEAVKGAFRRVGRPCHGDGAPVATPYVSSSEYGMARTTSAPKARKVASRSAPKNENMFLSGF